MNKALYIAVIMALTGCATSGGMVNNEVGAGQPMAYKEGYKDGCDSGYVAAGHPYYQFHKNVQRYAKDALYKQGWEDGRDTCKGKYDSITNMMH